MSRQRLFHVAPLQATRSFCNTHHALQYSRPPTAPKQVPDIAHIRQNVDLHTQNAIARNYEHHKDAPRQIAANAQRSSDITNILKEPRTELKALHEQMYLAKQADPKKREAIRETILSEIKKRKPAVDMLAQEQDELDTANRTLALSLPNLTSDHTPRNGEPKLLSYVSFDPAEPRTYCPTADHSIIGKRLQLIDFESAATVSGWGFYFLMNEGALLEQALIQYALSVAMRHGWKVVTPPSLVYSHIAESCGFQPRDQNDEQQIWQISQPAKDEAKPKLSLAATAEIPLAGLFAKKEIPKEILPVKVIGASRCYRAEAGARGVDTKGLYRVHEFTKVEMFGWADAAETLTSADSIEGWVRHSTELFDQMVEIQVEILRSLGLPCRVLEMPTSDLGASAFRKIDIEALFPSRLSKDEGWGEVTSASMCTDYQSRRLDTRILEGGSRKIFPQTVNGTAVAIPRVLAAILEHGWVEEEGCVVVPKVLRGFMGGIEKIEARP
jgi:seryl-tRNA synthetase